MFFNPFTSVSSFSSLYFLLDSSISLIFMINSFNLSATVTNSVIITEAHHICTAL